MSNPSFVYNETEVIKTGRTAVQKLRSGRVDTLFEITPKDQSVGQWKKWVHEHQLFIIEGEK